jgi:hypothetical protein
MEKVSFCSQIGQCELMAESAKNCWIVRFFPDGHQELYLNLQRVELTGPRSPLRTLVCRAADHLAPLIVSYLNTREEAEHRRLFWEIKEKLEKLES